MQSIKYVPFVGALSLVCLVAGCSSWDTKAYDPMDRMTRDGSVASKTERPVTNEAVPRDRVVPCADAGGDATASMDCEGINRATRSSPSTYTATCSARTDAQGNLIYDDPTCPTRYHAVATSCPSRADATGKVIYDDPTCPDRHRGLAIACPSHLDAKGNVVYDDPACPAGYRRQVQMGSSFENIAWTRESAFYDRYTDKALKQAREAQIAGNQGHIPDMVRRTEAALDQAKEAQRAGNQPDLNAGVMALRNTLTLVERDQINDALSSLRDARINLSRASGTKFVDVGGPVVVSSRGRVVKGELTRDTTLATPDGAHYVLRDRQNREVPIALSPDMSRRVHEGDLVEAQLDSKGQVVAISPAQ